MHNGSFLQMMFQQWSNGQSDCSNDCTNFVEMAARHNNTTPEKMLEELKKYRWFPKAD
jgi:hypothetical protein